MNSALNAPVIHGALDDRMLFPGLVWVFKFLLAYKRAEKLALIRWVPGALLALAVSLKLFNHSSSVE